MRRLTERLIRWWRTVLSLFRLSGECARPNTDRAGIEDVGSAPLPPAGGSLQNWRAAQEVQESGIELEGWPEARTGARSEEPQTLAPLDVVAPEDLRAGCHSSDQLDKLSGALSLDETAEHGEDVRRLSDNTVLDGMYGDDGAQAAIVDGAGSEIEHVLGESNEGSIEGRLAESASSGQVLAQSGEQFEDAIRNEPDTDAGVTVFTTDDNQTVDGALQDLPEVLRSEDGNGAAAVTALAIDTEPCEHAPEGESDERREERDQPIVDGDVPIVTDATDDGHLTNERAFNSGGQERIDPSAEHPDLLQEMNEGTATESEGMVADSAAAASTEANESAEPDALPADDEGLDSPPEKESGSERRRLPRRPPPPEDSGEYAAKVQAISTCDQEYARWNSAVVEQLLLAKSASENVYLCVNPRTLAWAFGEAGFDQLTATDAEQRLAAAVANIYRRRVLEHSGHLRVLRRFGDDGSPECAAFLAASVLAAYHMQSDEEMSGNAYYRRLADLLGCGMSGAHPLGFNVRVFESLWIFLRNWLREAHGRSLAEPASDVGQRRFVALPLAHVPLRSLDIEKLPVFFAWAGYEPGSRIRRERLGADLRLWQQSRNMLTQTGAEALCDDRSEAVLAQVSAELETWDGAFSESVSRRSALVEIQFDVIQRQPVFAYLPRRPPGFPTVFDDGQRVFEASDEGWYDPEPIVNEDGDLLASGFEWLSSLNRTQYTLRRSGALAIPLTPSSNYSGFLSSRRLLRGVRCSVLCHQDVLSTVEEFLSEVAQQRLRAANHPSLPKGWSIVRDFTAHVHIEAPPDLGQLEIDPNVDLVLSGGLRVGRRWSWVAGAPPEILVTGMEVGETAKVNGSTVAVSDAGQMMTDGLFSEPGDYLIEAGQTRRRIEVVIPQMSVNPNSDGTATDTPASRAVRTALPQGDWTLIGAGPGELAKAQCTFRGGAIATCQFQPIWAVRVSAGPGATVAVLTKLQPPRSFSRRGLTRSSRNNCGQWAGVIYDANIRRPQFLCMNGIVPGQEMEVIWKQYAAAAREIKRALKGT